MTGVVDWGYEGCEVLNLEWSVGFDLQDFKVTFLLEARQLASPLVVEPYKSQSLRIVWCRTVPLKSFQFLHIQPFV